MSVADAWIIIDEGGVLRMLDEEVNEMIGVRIGGLSEEAIDNYTVCYSFESPQSKIEDHQEPQGKCTICMEEFTTGDVLRCLPCLHSYHVPCIDKWLSLSQSCPVCKHNVMATTTPCFDSPTGQMRCPIPSMPHAWHLNHFNRPRPSFQVIPRLPLLRGGPLPPSQAASASATRPGLPGVSRVPQVPRVPGVPASSTQSAIPVYRGVAPHPVPCLAPVLRGPRHPGGHAGHPGSASGVASTAQPRIQPQSESDSESSSSSSSSGSSTP